MKTRLYIISGKGGTGKTSIAMALTKLLREQGKNALYTAFDHEVDFELANNLNIPFFNTTVEKSCEKYIELKLKSKTIANWIMKTPFFKALFSILPSLGSMILLGHYIKELQDNSDLIIVLDSPATGHAKSMIDATYNFKEIFKTGVLVEDIHKMHEFLFNPKNVKSFICSLPTEMSLQEAGELKQFMLSKGYENTSIILNNFIQQTSNSTGKLDFLNHKYELEKNIIEDFAKTNPIEYKIPKVFCHSTAEIVKQKYQLLEAFI